MRSFAYYRPGLNGIPYSELLRTVPDSLESLISEKRLLNAATLLMKSLKTIRKSELLEIGAISDLRSYLIGQETVRPFSLLLDLY